MLRWLTAAFVAICASVATAAEADLVAYKCSVRGSESLDIIQPLVFIIRDTASDRVVVSDAMILAFNDGQPVEGRLVVDNASRTTFAWTVDVILQVSPVKLRYRGTYVKSSGHFSILAEPTGYANNFTRGGTCQVDTLSR